MGYVFKPDPDWIFNLINQSAESAAQYNSDLRLIANMAF
jgi:hypothetical protein